MSSSKRSFKSKKPASKSGRADGADGDEHSIKLSNLRFLTVSEFKNKVRVDIREYYINDQGERKPGKKGISLSLEEWQKVVGGLDAINKSIKKLGGQSDEDDEEEEEEDENSEE